MILHHGDCIEYMRSMEANSVDSIVTDPPYHLKSIVKRFGKDGSAPAQFGTDGAYSRHSTGFMGKVWDGGEIAHDPNTWLEALRVAKPGAHLLAFGGTRTFHRLACAIEDAGWEIRDTIMWVYGSGFPKSHNLQDERKGWGTALKPAYEPIVVARKPIESTVAENVQEYGTGALNIDGCRVEGEAWKPHDATGLASVKFFTSGDAPVIHKEPHDAGRWPANLIHDGSEEVNALFPQTKSGDGKSGINLINRHKNTSGAVNINCGESNHAIHFGDSGSAARFFYCAKASKQDRDEGLEDLPLKLYGQSGGAQGALAPRASAYQESEDISFGMNAIKQRHNNHPTVKPTDLMRYLCRLVTPPNGIVFDPFMGSGSTGKAAVLEGFNFIGCDMEAEYVKIAEARINAAILPIFRERE